MVGSPMTDIAKKFDGEKTRLDLIPVRSMELLGRVLTFGAKKYAAYNWAQGFVWSRPYAATLRHLFAWWAGEDIDKDSGQPHLACAMCELVFLIEHQEHKLGVDDRPTYYAKETRK